VQVDHKHKLYKKWVHIWEKTRDGFQGEDTVKSKNTTYLPKLGGQDDKSYEAYLDRARYINYTGRTANIAIGQLFRKLPQVMGITEEARKNVDLTGRSFYYFSKELAKEVLITNRVGVLVDYSDEQGRTYLTQYKAEEIINWKTQVIGGLTQLSLVVLEGVVNDSEDVFKCKEQTEWRVLILEEGVYYVRDYIKKETSANSFEFVLVREFIPKMNGKTMDFIPFYFITNQGITFEISSSPMLDFVNVNLGHYKNSADYENMLHWTGAKTIIVKGWDDSKVFPVGGCAKMPTDGDAKFLEAASDSGLKDELVHKEEQMAAMGTSLISGKGRYVQSAETSRIQSQGEYATLADISNALSDSMTIVANVMAEWDGNTDEINIEYNGDFELSEVDPQTLTSFMGAVQAGYMSWETYFYNMQNKELYPDGWTIKDEQKSIEETQESIVIEEEAPMQEDIVQDEEAVSELV
jgi:hypothetical protein